MHPPFLISRNLQTFHLNLPLKSVTGCLHHLHEEEESGVLLLLRRKNRYFLDTFSALILYFSAVWLGFHAGSATDLAFYYPTVKGGETTK